MNNPSISYLILFFLAALFGCSTPPPAKARVNTVADLVQHEPLIKLSDRIALETGIDPDLGFTLLFAESGYKENALSKTNAVGIAQVLRSTGKSECKLHKLSELAKEENNIRCGFSYLKKLKGQFGTWRNALAAYNMGPGNFLNPRHDPKKYREGLQYAKDILAKSKFKENS